MYSDGKKRRPFLAVLFAAGALRRYVAGGGGSGCGPAGGLQMETAQGRDGYG